MSALHKERVLFHQGHHVSAVAQSMQLVAILNLTASC